MVQKSESAHIPKWAQIYDVVLGNEDTTDEIQKGGELEQLLNSSMARNFIEGEVFKGRIVNISDEYVTIDIGYKQEGLVYTKEFRSFDGTLKIKSGDEIDVYLEKLESTLGNLVLSKDKAEIIKAWDRISHACEKGEPVEGTVIQKVKGGLSVDIGVKAFLPGSQIDLRPTRNLDKFIGKTMKFKVIKFNKKRGNIVLSRRAILQEERGKLRDETLSAIQEGMIVKGIVKNITDYGAFIDLGGVDGLLHITDMSWGRVKHPSNLLNVGDEIEVKILKYDQEKERVSLGLKQVQPNPWDNAATKFAPNSKVKGIIVSIKDYGIFVELDGGIEGLVHISEMSWTQKIKHPSKLFNAGDEIEAMVLELDVENKRISLGLKQLQPNPWDALVKKYDIGLRVKGTIKSIVDFGIFVDLGEEVDALIHISDISWTRKNINLQDEYKVGDKLEAKVLTVDKDNQKFCLGVKQLEEDPWKRIEERFPVGTIIQAEVVRVTEFGAFVELETGIEGLIHISELAEERVEKPSDVVKKGDRPLVMVISVDKDSKKIALSLKAVEKAESDSAIKSFNRHDEMKTATLADKFKKIDLSNN
ncbi:MAG: 30S ribosomal protein S1 [Oligoflexia bacterium]|nr:30S ribosomal protein S1 [Oligoflexia bacterium]MBF0364266.1 30S ribosomal protein S1 [Oligoflexia bacterium]